MIEADAITGLILCGGRGSRMGGVDKGLQNHRGSTLAMHAMLRLGPQVGAVIVNANRNLGAYESMGVPVWPDPVADFAGPLAGWLAGLEHCDTPYLLTVPCDTPDFPLDLAQRLAEALERDDAEIAMAASREPGEGGESGELRSQPVFCLLKTTLLESLVAYLNSGGRKIDRWTATHRCVTVEFPDPLAFFNANTTQELQQLQQSQRPQASDTRPEPGSKS